LRRTLGEDQDLIKTIPGRGYLFALETEASHSPVPRAALELMDLHGLRGPRPTPMMQLHSINGRELSSIPGDVSAETRTVLNHLLDSLKKQYQGSVILLIQFAT
jgi:hypothetical protein